MPRGARQMALTRRGALPAGRPAASPAQRHAPSGVLSREVGRASRATLSPPARRHGLSYTAFGYKNLAVSAAVTAGAVPSEVSVAAHSIRAAAALTCHACCALSCYAMLCQVVRRGNASR